MKLKKLLLVAAGAFLFAFAANSAPKNVTLSKEVLKDKIKGAWAGKAIGCTYGGPTEFKYAAIINKNVNIPWSDHELKKWFDHTPGLYDDIYMDLTFVEVFDKEGLDAPVESFAKAFANARYPLWHANLQARYNILHGVMPPQSGHWTQNAHADDIDFQIEADYAGIMAPGMVNTATHYTDEIGHIMNCGDGWYGGVYVAAMLSLAFTSNNVEYVVTEGLKVIPKQSKFYKAMKYVIELYHKYPKDWDITWVKFNNEYNFDRGCPDGVYNNYNIDALINSGYIIIGLLYGQKNFYRTIDISCRCGADSDCNPSSAAGILGAMLGYKNIPEYWKRPVEEVQDRDFVYTDISINKATEMSYKQALQVIERNGGKVDGDKLVIASQKPVAVRYEEAFPNHYPIYRNYVRRNISSFGEREFKGNGVVCKYHFIGNTKALSQVAPEYQAKVETYIDGELAQTLLMPIAGIGMTRELCYIYNLPVKDHKITLKWVNPTELINIYVDEIIVYSDELVMTAHEDK